MVHEFSVLRGKLSPSFYYNWRSTVHDSRPLNSRSATVRLTVSALISRSHGGGLISHGLLSSIATDLPNHTTGGINSLWKG